MADRVTIQRAIDRAIQAETELYIRYRDYHGNVSKRKVSPLEWVEPEKILAYCHLRNDQRHFRLNNIIDISWEPLQSQEVASRQVAEQSTIQSAITRPTPRPTRALTSAKPNQPLFNKVTSTEDWGRLLEYYRECLNHEYQQQFSLRKSALHIVDLPDEIAYQFISGATNIELRLSSQADQLQEFLDGSRRRNQQLCFGKSFVCPDAEKISPLLFVPVTVEKSLSNTILLKPEEYSLSYAALMNLGFDTEEISDFLSCYETYIENQPSLEQIEQFITQSLSERLSRPLPIFSHEVYSLASITNYSIFDGNGLFWVNNQFTGNLITELQELTEYSRWQTAPETVKFLFSQMPEHEHAPAPSFIEDERFYVTNINEQQRKAARAVAEHAITVVTGPPGTGKSQLVLNLIAQAYLDGKTVLFASHNNKAVDVVMDRLQGEIRFQGAIRTGSRPNRKRAVEQMESAIAQIHHPSIKDFENRYREGKLRLKTANEQLDLIRDLKGKINSYLLEKQDILEKLTDDQREQFEELQLAFIENEKIQLNAVLSDLAEEFRALISERQQLVSILREAFTDRQRIYPAIQTIQEYEEMWGPFADGLLCRDQFSSLTELLSFCSLVKRLLASITAKKNLWQAHQAYLEVKREIDFKTEAMAEEMSTAVLLLEDYSREKFLQVQRQVNTIRSELRLITERRFSFFKKIAVALHLIDPYKHVKKTVSKLLIELEMNSTHLQGGDTESRDLHQKVEILSEAVTTADLLRDFARKQESFSHAQSEFYEISNEIPQDYISEFERLNLSNFDATSLTELISEVEKRTQLATDRLSSILSRCSTFFLKNNELIETVEALKQWAGMKEWDAFGLSEDATEDHALAWVHLWQKVIVIWEANAIIQHSKIQMAHLPSEDEALFTYQQASQSLFSLAGELMRATWYSRARKVSNAIFEGTQNYISAIKQLNELDYGKDAELYRALKDAERRNFTSALKMFPVWAITNLTARTNFPLDPGLFDLVIIDEASQCDIPSAIPLLFRAKKVVIIGDPNQLRHVATLSPSLDHQIGQKHRVGLDSLSYISHSLYDLGERSIGFHPGAILLNEHYRSDPRIITFSNEEFYGNQLIVKTDLTRMGYQKDYLNKCGGAYWLNVEGDFHRPPNGSAYNVEELKQIASIVPQLISALNRDGYQSATIGIVTPFRAQETKIREWLVRTFPGNSRIKSGTAHQFQGDECDIILFSPVLSTGIPEGTLNWLEQTYNLLNVAITRPRVSLVILGDFNFCYYDLPAKSRFFRLAKYIKERLDGVVETLDALPIIGGERVELLGTLLDPSNPEANRTSLIRFIETCRDYIYWIDPYFDQGIIDLFDELFDEDRNPQVKHIRLITAERQIKTYLGKPPALRPDSVLRLQEFLETKGVDFEMRVLRGEELPHDRFLYHPIGAINMPPFAGAFGRHRHLSEYTPSKTTIDDFNTYWSRGISVENY